VKAGRVREARQVLDQLERSPDRRDTQQPYFQTLAYAALGDKERALALPEKHYEVRSPELLGLKSDPAWDSLRGDPRFQDFLANRVIGGPEASLDYGVSPMASKAQLPALNCFELKTERQYLKAYRRETVPSS
jgi:hypothetical protein